MVSFRSVSGCTKGLILAHFVSTIAAVPTLEPTTEQECNIEVGVECIDKESGINCRDITGPMAECSVGDDITMLKFQIISSGCFGSGNTQDTKFACQGTSLPIPEEGSKIQVSCSGGSENGNVILEEETKVGEFVQVENSSGLPGTLFCTIKNHQGNVIQKLAMDTSGGFNLYLKNTFGMLQLEACKVIDLPIQACIVPIQYIYTFTNHGDSFLGFNKIEETRNENYREITDEPMTRSGDSTTLTVEESIDICVPEFYKTTVRAETETRQGSTCFDLNVYAFDFTGLGQLDIDVTCTSKDGYDCQELPAKTSECWTEIIYKFDVHNIGTTDLYVEYLEVLQNGHDLDAAFLADKDLVPGEVTTVDYIDHLNLCVSGVYETTAIAKARSQTIGMFENSETYNFNILVTQSPSKVPTSTPSQSPTASIAPSATPSSSPSAMPTDQCDIGITLDCNAPLDVSPDGSCTFDYTEPPGCEQTPTEMTLRYHGGDCTASSNLQGKTVSFCEDFQFPSTEESSYITVFDFEEGKSYFNGFVKVGSDFVVKGPFSTTMDINIYETNGSTDPTEIVKPENILQTIVFDVSCTENLFLRDRFGSIQLVEFKNTLQGTISCFQSLTLNFQVSSAVDVELSIMDIVTNIETNSFGIFNVTNKVAGKTISPGNTLVDEQIVTIDLGQYTQYTAVGTVVGKAAEGHKCYGSDSTTFEAGAPLPSSVPSVAPTIAPSESPTPDPRFAKCELDASIICKTRDAESCFDLKSPVSNTCIGGKAQELSFFYLPSSMCNGTNAQTGFECTDFNTEINRPFEVFVNIFRGQDIFFKSAVMSGQIFKVPIPELHDDMQIRITTTDDDGGVALQESKMSVLCQDESDLTLLRTFGHLQLVGFENPEMSSQTFADIELTYIVTNIGLFNANLRMATLDSALSGIDEILKPEDPKIEIKPNYMHPFVTTSTINLAASTGFSFDFYFDIIGEGTLSGKICNADSRLSINIG